MARRKTPATAIRLKGEGDVRLDVTLGALLRFEDATGKSPFDPATWETPRAGEIVTFIWAALPAELRERYPEPGDVADRIEIPEALKAVTAIAEVIAGNPTSPPSKSS